MGRWYPLGSRGLGIVLLVLFTTSWFAQWFVQVVRNGETGYDFLVGTFENWQSEFLQLLTFVVLTSIFVWRGSPESRDGDDELKDQLERMERKLDQLTR